MPRAKTKLQVAFDLNTAVAEKVTLRAIGNSNRKTFA